MNFEDSEISKNRTNILRMKEELCDFFIDEDILTRDIKLCDSESQYFYREITEEFKEFLINNPQD